MADLPPSEPSSSRFPIGCNPASSAGGDPHPFVHARKNGSEILPGPMGVVAVVENPVAGRRSVENSEDPSVLAGVGGIGPAGADTPEPAGELGKPEGSRDIPPEAALAGHIPPEAALAGHIPGSVLVDKQVVEDKVAAGDRLAEHWAW